MPVPILPGRPQQQQAPSTSRELDPNTLLALLMQQMMQANNNDVKMDIAQGNWQNSLDQIKAQGSNAANLENLRAKHEHNKINMMKEHSQELLKLRNNLDMQSFLTEEYTKFTLQANQAGVSPAEIDALMPGFLSRREQEIKGDIDSAQMLTDLFNREISEEEAAKLANKRLEVELKVLETLDRHQTDQSVRGTAAAEKLWETRSNWATPDNDNTFLDVSAKIFGSDEQELLRMAWASAYGPGEFDRERAAEIAEKMGPENVAAFRATLDVAGAGLQARMEKAATKVETEGPQGPTVVSKKDPVRAAWATGFGVDDPSNVDKTLPAPKDQKGTDATVVFTKIKNELINGVPSMDHAALVKRRVDNLKSALSPDPESGDLFFNKSAVRKAIYGPMVMSSKFASWKDRMVEKYDIPTDSEFMKTVTALDEQLHYTGKQSELSLSRDYREDALMEYQTQGRDRAIKERLYTQQAALKPIQELILNQMQASGVGDPSMIETLKAQTNATVGANGFADHKTYTKSLRDIQAQYAAGLRDAQMKDHEKRFASYEAQLKEAKTKWDVAQAARAEMNPKKPAGNKGAGGLATTPPAPPSRPAAPRAPVSPMIDEPAMPE